MKQIALAFALATATALAFAQSTPAGLWKTVDDDGKTEKSTVRIVEAGGVFSGKVEKIADAAHAGDRCVDCEGEARDRPIVGLTIITGVRQDAGDPGVYDGGHILDPTKGKTYKVRLKPLDGGSKLEVRGYIGTPMLGRTQTWIRAE